MIEGGRVSQDKTVGVQANRYEGYMVWINALVASAGGEIITNAQAGKNADTGHRLARRRRGRRDRRHAGPLRGRPAGPVDRHRGGGPLGVPGRPRHVHGQLAVRLRRAPRRRRRGALSQSVVDDIGWARYPRGHRRPAQRPPLGGINLAIGDFTKHPDQALDAVKCITSLESNIEYMVDSGNPAARAAAYDDPAVRRRSRWPT